MSSNLELRVKNELMAPESIVQRAWTESVVRDETDERG